MNYFPVLAALILAPSLAFSGSHNDLLDKVRRADPKAVEKAYRLYRESTNVSDRQELREVLQTTLDIDPRLLLRIKGLNVDTFCDGGDIASISNDYVVIDKVDRRIAKINISATPSTIKHRCIKSLSRLKTCTISKNC